MHFSFITSAISNDFLKYMNNAIFSVKTHSVSTSFFIHFGDTISNLLLIRKKWSKSNEWFCQKIDLSDTCHAKHTHPITQYDFYKLCCHKTCRKLNKLIEYNIDIYHGNWQNFDTLPKKSSLFQTVLYLQSIFFRAIEKNWTFWFFKINICIDGIFSR